MDFCHTPESVSHESLLAAVDERYADSIIESGSVYFVQLRHSLLSLARKARLEVMVAEVTGLPVEEIHSKSTSELLSLLDKQRSGVECDWLNRWWP